MFFSNLTYRGLGKTGNRPRKRRYGSDFSLILEQGGTAAEVKAGLGLPHFVAEKISAQSRRYSLGALERIYRRLLVMDTSMKSGSDSEVILDVMVAGLTVS